MTPNRSRPRSILTSSSKTAPSVVQTHERRVRPERVGRPLGELREVVEKRRLQSAGAATVWAHPDVAMAARRTVNTIRATLLRQDRPLQPHAERSSVLWNRVLQMLV